jgi:hypothetical protein
VRIPFPVHIPLSYVTGFAAVMLAVQLVQGTMPLFALCCFLFIVIAGIAFNLAGGFSRPSGSYVFFYAVLGVIVGLVWKAALGEPADSNLIVPLLTMKVYLGGITAMLIAVFISGKLTLRHALLENLVTDANLQNATVGCLITGLVVTALLTFVPHSSGSFLTALAQINRFLPMALILGVILEIRRSRGKSAFNFAVLISATVILANGIIGYSKEGIFMPVACWVAAAGSQRYRLSRIQVFGIILIIFVMFRYLVPYAQYGRNFPTDSPSDRIVQSVEFLSDIENVRGESARMDKEGRELRGSGYFSAPQGFVERLQMISIDDALIDVTEREGTFGPLPIIFSFKNLVPHFLWPDKPSIGFGNVYGRKVGVIGEEDESTGISFSPTAEAYYIARWTGLFIYAPLIWIMLFVTFDSLCGDTRISPWGLLMIAYFAHIAPEGMLDTAIYAEGYMAFGLVVAALSAAYVMPIVGTLIKGPEQVTVRRIAPIRSVPRRSRSTP